jgi:uncharacterized SAM-binding protein YcdF (DUF218 family)
MISVIRWRTRSRLTRAAGALLASSLLLILLHRQVLAGIGGLLIVEDPAPARVDLIFLLNGGINTRPFRAAELYKQGLAPRIVIAQSERLPTELLRLTPNPTEVSIGVLDRLGVPASAIVVLPFGEGTTSTRDEARALRSYLEAPPARRLAVVTSDYHTRRTRAAVRREIRIPGVRVWMISAPEAYTAQDWWRGEVGFLAYLEEFLKIAHSTLYRG